MAVSSVTAMLSVSPGLVDGLRLVVLLLRNGAGAPRRTIVGRPMLLLPRSPLVSFYPPTLTRPEDARVLGGQLLDERTDQRT